MYNSIENFFGNKEKESNKESFFGDDAKGSLCPSLSRTQVCLFVCLLIEFDLEIWSRTRFKHTHTHTRNTHKRVDFRHTKPTAVLFLLVRIHSLIFASYFVSHTQRLYGFAFCFTLGIVLTLTVSLDTNPRFSLSLSLLLFFFLSYSFCHSVLLFHFLSLSLFLFLSLSHFTQLKLFVLRFTSVAHTRLFSRSGIHCIDVTKLYDLRCSVHHWQHRFTVQVTLQSANQSRAYNQNHMFTWWSDEIMTHEHTTTHWTVLLKQTFWHCANTLVLAFFGFYLSFSSAFLVGPWKQVKTMCHEKRRIATTVYLITIVLTLVVAFEVCCPNPAHSMILI
jgi:hypothetical protein